MNDPTAARCANQPDADQPDQPCGARPAPIRWRIDGELVDVCPSCFITLFDLENKATAHDS